MNTHARKTIGFICSILVLGLTVLNPAPVQSNPIYYGMVDRDTSILVKVEPGNSYHIDSGTLSIPGVVLFDQHANKTWYHKIKLQYDPDIDAYKLMRADAVSFNENIVEQVDLVMTGEQPVQVFLKLSGYFNYSCGNVLIVNHGRAKYMDKPQYVSRFEVTVSSYNQFSGSEVEAPCTTDGKLYTLVLPLEVYDLSAGAYEYAVNGAHTGTFELKSKNAVPDDLLKVQSEN